MKDIAAAKVMNNIQQDNKRNANYDENISIGILQIDYDYPPALGDVCHPDSFGHKVVYEKIKGLTFSACQKAEITPELELSIQIAVRKLEEKGVMAITGDCGFLHSYQDVVLNYSQLPVFMSPLIQLPLIEASLRKDERIAIFTANSETFNTSLLPKLDRCILDPEGCKSKYQIVGCQNLDGFEAVALGEKVDVNKVMKNITQLAKETIQNDPKIKAFLFECTELPPYSNRVRNVTGLPVFDSLTTVESFCISKKSNSRIKPPRDYNTSEDYLMRDQTSFFSLSREVNLEK